MHYFTFKFPSSSQVLRSVEVISLPQCRLSHGMSVWSWYGFNALVVKCSSIQGLEQQIRRLHPSQTQTGPQFHVGLTGREAKNTLLLYMYKIYYLLIHNVCMDISVIKNTPFNISHFISIKSHVENLYIHTCIHVITFIQLHVYSMSY